MRQWRELILFRAKINFRLIDDDKIANKSQEKKKAKLSEEEYHMSPGDKLNECYPWGWKEIAFVV